MNNHASSLYGDQVSIVQSDGRTAPARAKHAVTSSQSVVQSMSVLSTEHPAKKKPKAQYSGESRIRDKIRHKKTASIAG